MTVSNSMMVNAARRREPGRGIKVVQIEVGIAIRIAAGIERVIGELIGSERVKHERGIGPFRCRHLVGVSVGRVPRIQQHGAGVGQRIRPIAHRKEGQIKQDASARGGQVAIGIQPPDQRLQQLPGVAGARIIPVLALVGFERGGKRGEFSLGSRDAAGLGGAPAGPDYDRRQNPDDGDDRE